MLRRSERLTNKSATKPTVCIDTSELKVDTYCGTDVTSEVVPSDEIVIFNQDAEVPNKVISILEEHGMEMYLKIHGQRMKHDPTTFRHYKGLTHILNSNLPCSFYIACRDECNDISKVLDTVVHEQDTLKLCGADYYMPRGKKLHTVHKSPSGFFTLEQFVKALCAHESKYRPLTAYGPWGEIDRSHCCFEGAHENTIFYGS